MNILLTGASGFIASHLQHALQQNEHNITACRHRKHIKQQASIRTITVDFMRMHQAKDWSPYLKDIDLVINSVGIITESKRHTFEQLHYQAPVSLFQACEQMGVKRVIQISALGADESAIFPYHLSKLAADNVLRNSTLDWFVLRPSLVYGKGGESFALFQTLSNLPVIPLIDDGQQMIQPVHISDLVATVLRCLESDVPSQQTIDVIGEQAISYKGWMIGLRTKQSKPYFLALPLSLMMKLSQIGRRVGLPLFTPDNLRMLQQNSIASSEKLAVLLGRKPLGLGEKQ